jgi:hypothetical protein
MTPSAQTAGGRRVRRWTRELIIDKILEWEVRYGEPPCSADWNPSLARWRAQEWRADRYRDGVWPSTNAAKRQFGGSFDAAVRAAGLEPHRPGPRRAAGTARPAVEPRDARASDPWPATEPRPAPAADRDDPWPATEPRASPPALPPDASDEDVERLVAEARARVRAADDQVEAAVRDAAEARRAAAAAERRVRELGALVTNGGHRLTAGELAALRSDRPSGPAVLATALRRLAKARAAGDRGGLRSALGEVAAAAVRWRDRL